MTRLRVCDSGQHVKIFFKMTVYLLLVKIDDLEWKL